MPRLCRLINFSVGDPDISILDFASLIGEMGCSFLVTPGTDVLSFVLIDKTTLPASAHGFVF
jgi:hypothetical protein